MMKGARPCLNVLHHEGIAAHRDIVHSAGVAASEAISGTTIRVDIPGAETGGSFRDSAKCPVSEATFRSTGVSHCS
jgi:hypothetical protein